MGVKEQEKQNGTGTESSDSVDVDKIWIALGSKGRYQMTQLLVILISIWSSGFHYLAFVFIAYRPKYACSHVTENYSSLFSNVSAIKIEYNKCSTKILYNATGVITTEESECISGWNYTYPDHEYFPKERSFVSEWNLVCGKEEFTEISQTIVMVGQAVGSFLFTSLADKFGRRPVHIGCHVSLFLVTLATSFTPGYSSFVVMRFLTGAFAAGMGLTGAILNLEMFPMQIRSNVEVAGLLFWSTGIALITPIAYLCRNLSWRYLQISLSCMSGWSLIQWWLTEESLRWLIANGKYEAAKAILQKACKMNKKNYGDVIEASGLQLLEMKQMKDEYSKDKQENLVQEGNDVDGTKAMNNVNVKTSTKKYTVIDLVKSKHLFASTLIMWFTWTTNSATYYGIMLLSSSLAGNRFLNFFLGSVVEYPAALLEYAMFNRYGRKPTCIMFHTICCVALLTATILTTTANGSKAMLLGSTVFTLIGKFAITGSFSTIFLYTPELYPTNMRNLGIGLSSAAARVGAMLAPFSRNLAEVYIWAPGLIFGIMCAIVAISMFWVPETNQRELPQTLEDTELWYKENQFRLPGTKKSKRVIS